MFGSNLKDPFTNLQKSIGETADAMRSKKFNTGKMNAQGRRNVF